MKLALVHEWLLTYAGSERVLAEVAQMHPEAPIFTLFHDPAALKDTPLANCAVTPSPLQRIPGLRRRHRLSLPLMPWAIEQLDVGEAEVVFSSSHAVAKGVLTRADQLHVSYVHTPARYAWDLYFNHLRQARTGLGPRGLLTRATLHYLRLWDLAASQRPDVLIANSHYVARRIAKHYRREAQVIHPPVAVERFHAMPDPQRDDFFLVVSRLVPYKQVDRIVRAAGKANVRLEVIGSGPERAKVEAAARPFPQITLHGELSDAQVAEKLAICRAVITAADEDFGIVTAEALAAGAPVLALRQGGAKEIVEDGRTGYFFDLAEEAAILQTLRQFEESRSRLLPAEAIREQALRFRPQRFQEEIRSVLEQSWERHHASAFAPAPRGGQTSAGSPLQ